MRSPVWSRRFRGRSARHPREVEGGFLVVAAADQTFLEALVIHLQFLHHKVIMVDLAQQETTVREAVVEPAQ